MSEIKVEEKTVQVTEYVTTDGQRHALREYAERHQAEVEKKAKEAAEWAAYKAAHLKEGGYVDSVDGYGHLVYADSAEALAKIAGTAVNPARKAGWYVYRHDDYDCHPSTHIWPAEEVLAAYVAAAKQIADAMG
jgi:hypothetical protein